MKTASIFDPSRLNVFVIFLCLIVLAVVTLPNVQEVQRNARVTACMKTVDQLVVMLIRYKTTFGSFPNEDGKAFLTYPYFIDDTLEPALLKCPGKGAVKDNIPPIDDLRPVIWDGDLTVEAEYGSFLRQDHWAKNVISYTGPYGATTDPIVVPVDPRWKLSHLRSPTPEERRLAREDKIKVGSDDILPLVADDDDAPKNHRAGYVIGFADKHTELRTGPWVETKWPFAALVRHAP